MCSSPFSRRPRGVLLVLGIVLVTTACRGMGGPPTPPGAEPVAVVSAFFEALSAGNRTEAEALLAPGFILLSWDASVLASRERYVAMMGWDAAAEGVPLIERTVVEEDTVTVLVRETNEFTRLLELEPFRLESRFVINSGLIQEQRLRELADGPSYTRRFEDAIAPVLRWAETAAPELLRGVSVDGAIRYDEGSARRLLRLIRLYQRFHG